jgi:phospholipid/cholesterol/gamma-HCH transport system substrate-binding protein
VKTTPALIKLVVFIVVTVLATGTLAATIGNFRFGGTTTYQALFTDVTGLLAGDDVRIAGVRVGEVKKVAVRQEGRRSLAEVTLAVDDNRPVAVSTRALIRYRNLVGQRYVALMEGAGSDRRLPEGGVLPLQQTQPALDLTVLFNGFKPLFAALSPKDVNAFAFEVVQTLQGEAGNINSLLAHTASLTTTLADRDAVIGRTIDNLNEVLATVDERDQQLSTLLSELQRFVSGLAEDRQAIGASLTNIAGLAESTAGLVKDGRPAIRTDVQKLGEVTGTLDDNRQLVDGFLKRFPTKLERVMRTATYGSWFNFYLCDFQGRVVIPAGGTKVDTRTINYHSTAARCD